MSYNNIMKNLNRLEKILNEMLSIDNIEDVIKDDKFFDWRRQLKSLYNKEKNNDPYLIKTVDELKKENLFTIAVWKGRLLLAQECFTLPEYISDYDVEKYVYDVSSLLKIKNDRLAYILSSSDDKILDELFSSTGGFMKGIMEWVPF